MAYINTFGQNGQNGAETADTTPISIPLPQGDITFAKPKSGQPDVKYAMTTSDQSLDTRIYTDVYQMATQEYKAAEVAKQTQEETAATQASYQASTAALEAPPFLRGAAAYVERNPTMGGVGAIVVGIILAKILN